MERAAGATVWRVGLTTYRTFFESHHSFLVGLAERRLGSREDAEDVSAQAMLLAWERHNNGKAVSVSWLCAVVRNLIGDEYRRRKRRAGLQSELSAMGMASMLAAPECDDIYDAVDRLPTMYRDVLRFAYWQGMTAPEIAEQIGVSPMAVRARMTRARRLIRASWTGAGEAAEVNTGSMSNRP